MNSMKQFEDKVKDKLQGYDAGNQSADWTQIKAKVPGKSGINLMQGVTIGAAVIIITASILLLNTQNNKSVSEDTRHSIDTDTKITNTTDSEKVQNQTAEKELNNTENNNQSPENTSLQPSIKQDIKTITRTEIQENSIHPGSESNKLATGTDSIESKNDVPENTAEPPYDYEISADKSSGCPPLDVSFGINAPENQYLFNWNFGNGNEASSAHPQTTFQEPGTYEVRLSLKAKHGNLPNPITENFTINVKEPPEVKFDFDTNANLYIFNSLSKTDNEYLWHIDEKEFTGKEVEYEFKRNGNYKVKLEATNEQGCKAFSEQEIAVSISHNYFVPNAFNASRSGEYGSFGPIGDNLENMAFSMQIFDKAGRLVFAADEPEKR